MLRNTKAWTVTFQRYTHHIFFFLDITNWHEELNIPKFLKVTNIPEMMIKLQHCNDAIHNYWCVYLLDVMTCQANLELVMSPRGSLLPCLKAVTHLMHQTVMAGQDLIR